jgi:D-methionine transport system ATP-binding protein
MEQIDSAIIKLQGISKTFKTKDKEVKALKNINIQIEKGDIFGVIGYSGAGKSTLIRIINLLETPDAGEVRVNGVSLTKITNKQLREIRSNIGMIFQGFNLMNSIDVFSNIAAPLKNRKVPKAQISAKVDELLKLVGLEDKKHAYPNQLSGGQKQRVAIARALSSDPQILLCDEATSALDPNTTQSILQLIREIHDKLGIVIVIITHQMEVIKSICNKVAVMEQGEIVEQGNIVDIFTDPKSAIGREFVSHSLGSDSAEKSFAQYKGTLYKLSFFGSVTHQPILSYLSQHYHVEVNILFGNIENLYDTVVGNLIVEFLGKEEDIQAAIEYYKSLDTKVEVIRNAQFVDSERH